MTELAADDDAVLRRAPFTYAEVGATADPTPPAGYRHLVRTRVLPGLDFDRAAHLVMSWQLQERSGIRVAASAATAEPDAVVLMRLGLGPASLRIPCRVVYTVDERDRAGFAYGTLPGHPERGEELFLVEHDAEGRPRLTISAFSVPATWLARAGGPATRWAQSLMTDRYLRALTSS